MREGRRERAQTATGGPPAKDDGEIFFFIWVSYILNILAAILLDGAFQLKF